ncbi:unnamed protein product [Symbiodinium sp. CCMP2592]|nr:unnamed protein product [Symbiodinium sp. CCMP2592]
MFNKRSLTTEDVQAVAPAKRFRSEMVDIFLNNELSSERSARVLRSAQQAGALHVEDLQVRPETRNTHRDLLRKCFRNTKWPSLYHAKVRGWNQAKNTSEEYSLAILLPHESLHSLLKVNTPEALLQQQAEILPDRPDLENHLHFLEGELGLDFESTLLMGMWCDGVPFNSDRSMTLETISLNIFGQQNLRLPVAAFPKEFVSKSQTFEDVFEIIQWSFKQLATGSMPSCRHDGTPFNRTDSYRQRLAGKKLPLRAALAEFRADWSCYKDVLSFPSWSSKGYPVISSMDFFMRQRQQNQLVSRLFSCPGFNTACRKMDFLHACDLGVTSDWLGSLLFYIQSEKIRGLSKLIRCAKLYQDIKAYYDRNGVQDRLPKLLPTMLREEDRGKIKSPKLRAKAGEARALVGAAMEMARKYLSPAKPAEQAMLHGTEALQSIYACLSTAAWDKEVFRVSSQKFLLLWGSLETYFEVDKLFRVKPKAHQLFELARGEVNPSKTWTYRDESYGHTLALLGKRRGGKFSMYAVSCQVLRRFLAANKVPRLEIGT